MSTALISFPSGDIIPAHALARIRPYFIAQRTCSLVVKPPIGPVDATFEIVNKLTVRAHYCAEVLGSAEPILIEQPFEVFAVQEAQPLQTYQPFVDLKDSVQIRASAVKLIEYYRAKAAAESSPVAQGFAAISASPDPFSSEAPAVQAPIAAIDWDARIANRTASLNKALREAKIVRRYKEEEPMAGIFSLKAWAIAKSVAIPDDVLQTIEQHNPISTTIVVGGNESSS